MPDRPIADRHSGAKVIFRVGGALFALPAKDVTRIAPLPRLAPLPGLVSPFLGVTSVSDRIVPVIDLGAALGLATALGSGELVVARYGKDIYALRVDQVVRIAADRGAEHDAAAGRQLDVAELLAGLRLPRAVHGGPGERTDRAGVPVSPIEPGVARRRRFEQAALVVETDKASYLVPLASIITLTDELAVAAVPDPDPVFAGAAIYRGQAVPVVRLDRLLGEPAGPGPHAYVIVAHRGAVVLAVKRIGALVAGADPDRLLPLARLLDAILPPQSEPFAAQADMRADLDERRPQRHQRYLVVEIGDHAYALALRDVHRVQSECRIVPVGAGRLHVDGLTTIGGRVLPLLDATAAFDVAATPDAAGGYVVVSNPSAGAFVLPVKSRMRIVSIPDEALRPIGQDAPVTAIAAIDGVAVRVLSAPLLARRAGWRRDAA
jgi:chemotaxis signal transduction protein